jgi:hypothetical protein
MPTSHKKYVGNDYSFTVAKYKSMAKLLHKDNILLKYYFKVFLGSDENTDEQTAQNSQNRNLNAKHYGKIEPTQNHYL